MGSLKLFLSKNILLHDCLISGGILIKDGKVEKILSNEECEQFASKSEVYDESDLVIMPGIIDSHVHVNEPGRTAWEGYETATKAAAAGGITTIVDMPLNSIPPTTTLDNLRQKVEIARNKVYVDVAFWGGVIPGNQNELLPMIKAGVVGFKCFMCPSGVEEFPNVTYNDIEKALKVLENTDSVLAFHAEVEIDKEWSEEETDTKKYETFLNSRPSQMEIKAIKQIIELSTKYNARLHIVHLSAAEALPMIEKAKNNGANLTVETCHHYLNLSSDKIPCKATQFKCCPPLRDVKNKEMLWKALENDILDMVVSDHSPCTPDLKLLSNCKKDEEMGDFIKAWGGIASVQFGLSLFWTAAKERNFKLSDVSKYLTRATAKLVRLHTKKGHIKTEFDADFVIWDPSGEIEITENMIEHKNKITPYLGTKLCGKVYKTVVRGNIVYKLDEPMKDPKGKLLIKI